MINWQQICWDIRKHYGSLTMVAKEINYAKSAINKIARGETKQPYYDTGCKLLAIHKKAMERANNVG